MMVHDEISVAILVISIISLYMVVNIYSLLVGSIKYPTISGFFFLKFLIFAFIGSVLLNVTYFEYEITLGFYSRKDLLLTLWMYCMGALWLQVLGIYLANIVLCYRPAKGLDLVKSNQMYFVKSDHSNSFKLALFLLLLTGLLALKMYLNEIETIPINGLFMELAVSDLARLRSDAGNNFDGRFWLYRLFMKELPLLLFMIVFFFKNKSFFWKVSYWFLFLSNIFVSIMSLEKAPIIQFFLLIILLNLYQKNKVDWKLLGTYFLLISTSLILMYFFFMGMGANHDIFDVVSAIFHRIFIGQISQFWWWQLYQEQFGYLYGLSMPNPMHIFPFDHKRITVEVMNFAHPELSSLGRVGSMPTIYFADWFINFGTIMACFSMIFFGFITQLLDILILRKLAIKKTLLLSVLYVYLIEYFAHFSGTSFFGIVFDLQWIVPSLIIFVLYLVKIPFSKNLKKLTS